MAVRTILEERIGREREREREGVVYGAIRDRKSP